MYNEGNEVRGGNSVGCDTGEGAVWAGAVIMRAGVPWEWAVPLPYMLIYWQQLSTHQALYICQIALSCHIGHH